jgi:hypothetical protein
MECILVLRQSQSTETANTESQNSHGPVCHVAMFSPRLYCDFMLNFSAVFLCLFMCLAFEYAHVEINIIA